MTTGSMLRRARECAGLTEAELAARAGTAQSAVSAYEHDRKAPTSATLRRLARATGHRLVLEPAPTWTTRTTTRGRPFDVPDVLPRLPLDRALASVVVPVDLMWSGQSRALDLSDRRHRARVYRVALVEGTAEDIERYVDGALLVDLWDDLVLPDDIRHAWAPLVEAARGR